MAREDRTPHPGVSGREFVALIAMLMAIGALGIDVMLPALPAIGGALGVGDANTTQFVITAYTLGFGVGQLFFGPLADRYGRKPVLVVSIGGFVALSVLAALAQSFTLLIVARLLQGGFGAATRVLVTSIVRDCYSGRRMARVMSVASMLFFAVPILAPALGTLVLQFGDWRASFWTLAALGGFILVWTSVRLPETLAPGSRRRISIANLREAYAATLGNRFSLGYALGQAVMFGALMGYISSSEQIIGQVFDAREQFPLIFAIIAAAMGVSVFGNSRLVERFGTRKLSHGATLAVIAIGLAHVGVTLSGRETLGSFILFQALLLGAAGLIGSNFSAMAMAPVGHIAGTAASVQGFISNVGAALLGIAIGQQFDGTTMAVALSYPICGAVVLAIILVVERGRLFVAHDAPLPAKPGG